MAWSWVYASSSPEYSSQGLGPGVLQSIQKSAPCIHQPGQTPGVSEPGEQMESFGHPNGWSCLEAYGSQNCTQLFLSLASGSLLCLQCLESRVCSTIPPLNKQSVEDANVDLKKRDRILYSLRQVRNFLKERIILDSEGQMISWCKLRSLHWSQGVGLIYTIWGFGSESGLIFFGGFILFS